jgi:hypothetical protein
MHIIISEKYTLNLYTYIFKSEKLWEINFSQKGKTGRELLDESASKPEASQHAKIKINKLLLKENERRGEYYACGRCRCCQTKKNVMITWAHMYLKEKQTLYACLKPIATTRGSARSLISIVWNRSLPPVVARARLLALPYVFPPSLGFNIKKSFTYCSPQHKFEFSSL